MNADLIIVGAGLVGATLACAIAQEDSLESLRIILVEASKDAPTFAGEDFDPRVVALTQASQNLLTKIGIWEKISAHRACAYREMQVWDGEGTAEIHFDCADLRTDHLGHIVENSVILSALHEQLKLHPQISLIQPARIVNLHRAEQVSLELDNGDVISADLIIAADGAHSSVRDLANFSMREWDYGHTAIVTTVQTELPHNFTAWQRFMHTGPLAFLPLPITHNKHFCSIVWSVEKEFAEALIQLSAEEFCHRLGNAFEHKLGAILGVAERFAIPLRQRHAKTYIQPQIALVGDAAHSIHPLAGQGVNLGLLDVAVLAREVGRALERQIPLQDFSMLRRYQRQRMPGNLTMMSVMEAFKRLFGSRSLMILWLRNSGMQQLNSLSALKKIIVASAMGLR